MSTPAQARGMVRLLRQLAVLTRLGYPLGDGLRAMTGRGAPDLGELADRLEQGDSTAQVLSHPAAGMSESQAALVEAALTQPDAAAALAALGGWWEKSERLRRQAATALLYPTLALAVALALALVVCWGALGATVLALANEPSPLPVERHPAWLMMISTGLLGWLAWVSWDLLRGRAWGPSLALFPGLQRLHQVASQATWGRALGSLLAAGAPLPEALQTAAGAVESQPERVKFERLAESARRGSCLSQLAEAHPDIQLDPHLRWALAGQQPESALCDAAERMEDDVEAGSAHELRLLAARALLVLGVLVGGGIVLFWWPFYHLTGSLR